MCFGHSRAFSSNLKHVLKIEISTMKTALGFCELQRAPKTPQNDANKNVKGFFHIGRIHNPSRFWIAQPHISNRLVSDFWVRTSFWKNRIFLTPHVAFYKHFLTKFGYEVMKNMKINFFFSTFLKWILNNIYRSEIDRGCIPGFKRCFLVTHKHFEAI